MSTSKPIKVFEKTYLNELQILCARDPTFYGWVAYQTHLITRRMIRALPKGNYCLTNRALRATCDRLGINCSYKAIGEYINA